LYFLVYKEVILNKIPNFKFFLLFCIILKKYRCVEGSKTFVGHITTYVIYRDIRYVHRAVFSSPVCPVVVAPVGFKCYWQLTTAEQNKEQQENKK